jgi:hypothetical protein
MKSERYLNSLEAIFADHNVRLALLVDFGDVECPMDDKLSQVRDTCRSCRLGHMTLTCTDNKNERAWKLVTNASDEHTILVELKDTFLDLNDMGSFLDALIHDETLEAQGHVSVQLIPYRYREKQSTEDQDKIHSNDKLILYVNGNHAICDGRSITHFVALATNVLPILQPARLWKGYVLSDWKEWLEEIKMDYWEDMPCFLPGPNNTALHCGNVTDTF